MRKNYAIIILAEVVLNRKKIVQKHPEHTI